jgi:hypothetical protein
MFGIRLPNRHELIADPMEDDGVFTQVGDKAFLAIVEVKADLIAFNRTWTVPELKNVQRFLAAAGAFAPDKVEAIAHELYARGCFTADPFYHVSLVGIGILPATSTVSTLLVSINVTTVPGTLLTGKTLMRSAASMMMSASLPGDNVPILWSR